MRGRPQLFGQVAPGLVCSLVVTIRPERAVGHVVNFAADGHVGMSAFPPVEAGQFLQGHRRLPFLKCSTFYSLFCGVAASAPLYGGFEYGKILAISRLSRYVDNYLFPWAPTASCKMLYLPC